MKDLSNLFSSFRLGHLDLKNRIVMAPMTRNRAVEGNVPSSLAIDYYAQRASAGLLITEASQVSPQASATFARRASTRRSRWPGGRR